MLTASASAGVNPGAATGAVGPAGAMGGAVGAMAILSSSITATKTMRRACIWKGRPTATANSSRGHLVSPLPAQRILTTRLAGVGYSAQCPLIARKRHAVTHLGEDLHDVRATTCPGGCSCQPSSPLLGSAGCAIAWKNAA